MARINSRSKGQRGEREIIDLLQPIVDKVYGETKLEAPLLQRNTLQSDVGGYDVVGLPWLALEVKMCETFALDKWWEQTIKQAKKVRGSEPVLIYRRNRVAWRVRLLAAMPIHNSVAVQVHLVDISAISFVEYFTARLRAEMMLDLVTTKG